MPSPTFHWNILPLKESWGLKGPCQVAASCLDLMFPQHLTTPLPAALLFQVPSLLQALLLASYKLHYLMSLGVMGYKLSDTLHTHKLRLREAEDLPERGRSSLGLNSNDLTLLSLEHKQGSQQDPGQCLHLLAFHNVVTIASNRNLSRQSNMSPSSGFQND